MFINPLYLLLLVPAVLGWLARARVQAAYGRYGRVTSQQGIMGADVAERLIAYLGLHDVHIELTYGQYLDQYVPQDHALVLTEGIAASRSVTAMGIVAHEVLHAVQDAEGYPLLRVRVWLGSWLGRAPDAAFWMVLLGLLFRIVPLAVGGGVIMLATVILGLVALPVERNASTRALVALKESGLADGDDLRGAEVVLRSAAFTYVAGLCQQLSRMAFVGLVVAAALGMWQR